MPKINMFPKLPKIDITKYVEDGWKFLHKVGIGQVWVKGRKCFLYLPESKVKINM